MCVFVGYFRLASPDPLSFAFSRFLEYSTGMWFCAHLLPGHAFCTFRLHVSACTFFKIFIKFACFAGAVFVCFLHSLTLFSASCMRVCV